MAVEYLKFDEPETQARLGELVTFAVTKSNYAVKPGPVLLRRDADHGGALVPLTEAEGSLVESGRAAAAANGARASAKRTANTEAATAQHGAVLRAVAEAPGITWRKLCDRVAALCDCGDFTARKAIERASSSLDVRPGIRGASTYFLRKVGT